MTIGWETLDSQEPELMRLCLKKWKPNLVNETGNLPSSRIKVDVLDGKREAARLELRDKGSTSNLKLSGCGIVLENLMERLNDR